MVGLLEEQGQTADQRVETPVEADGARVQRVHRSRRQDGPPRDLFVVLRIKKPNEAQIERPPLPTIANDANDGTVSNCHCRFK